MHRRALCLSLCLGLALALAAGREGLRADPVVVELFTSQGCASCPPADAFLAELARRDDVLPLALHVDYWDYIGWADSFAAPAFTERQRRYAHAAGHSVVYTPQMIVAGREEIAGFRPGRVLAAIEAAAARPDAVRIDLARHAGRLVIEIAPRARIDGAARVIVVGYIPHRRVEILRGENAGRVVDYVNIVREWREIGMWDGAGPARFETPVAADRAAAVLVQADPMGPVLGAARVP